MKNTHRLAFIVAACALAAGLAGCSGANTPADGSLSVVATTTILGDIARNIVGTDGDVEVLIPIGADPHDYRASARQVAAMENADLVIVNGLALEESLDDVLQSVRSDGGRVFEVAELLNPLPFSTGDEPDPHVWMDPVRMADAARLIAEQMAMVDPEVDWAARANAYAVELLAADSRIEEILASVPAPDRGLVTGHDSLQYFAARYGFAVIGVVNPGGSTLAEPSSSELAGLVATIKAAGVQAIFTETTESAALAEAVAGEAGSGVAVVELHIGSLGGPGSGAETLIEMLITNAERIAEALR